jgi:hypothetical protein
MKTEYAKWFEQVAADPIRRRAAISTLTKRRNIWFGCASVITLCALSMFFTSTHNRISPILESFAACMSWITFVLTNSNLRALKLLEQFSDRDNKSSS